MKNAIVTGGTKGIGLQIIIHLLKKDYNVITNYSSDDEHANQVRAQLSNYGDRIRIVKANQANKDEFKIFVEYISRHFETIDCIICNAGSTIRKSAFDISDNEWESVFDVSVNSHYYLIRDLNKKINENSRIIFIGSMMGIYPHATSLPYGVCKAAVHALAKNLVKVFESKNTTVNAIAPGFVETEWQKNKPQFIRDNINKKTACGRFASPSEIVSAVEFCIENSFVNGSVIEINGGYCFK